MQLSHLPAWAAALLPLAPSAHAFWRMPCKRSGLARIDPLVSPGKASEHAHSGHGSSGFSPTSNYNDLIAADCTTCQVTEDKSAYWAPGLYFHSNEGSYTAVPLADGILAYYLLYTNENPALTQAITAFPPGFQMIAGNSNLRNFSDYPVPDDPKSNWVSEPYYGQAFLSQVALGFNCLDYSKDPEPSLYRHFLPNKTFLDANCPDGLRLELQFPSCWDGIHNDTANHKDHVAYPTLCMQGDCPSGFPVRLPTLFYETIYNTQTFTGQEGTFVLANGDESGYGYHGDFQMGWPAGFLQPAVDTCTASSGEISDCALFNTIDELTYQANAGQCQFAIPPEVASDNVLGPAPILPGNVQIALGPAYALGAAAAASPVAAATTSPAAAASAAPVPITVTVPGPAAPATTADGGVFAQIPSGNGILSAGEAMGTVTPVPAAAAASSAPSYFATSWTTMGRVVEEVLWVEELVTVTETEASAPTGLRKGKRHGHAHQHRRRGH